MKLKNLNLINFRNHNNVYFDFDDNINIFLGNNGAGKTNILESIYVLAITKSFRTSNDKNLINFEKKFCKIESTILKNNISYFFDVLISSKGKRVSINENIYKKISDYLSNLNVILFSQDDIELIKGSPSYRRKYINIEISQLNNKYLYVLNQYNLLLKNRNEYLKKVSIDNYDKFYIDILNNQLMEKALLIYKFRFDFFEKMNFFIKEIYNNFFSYNISLKYINNLDIDFYDEKKISDFYLNKMKSNIKNDIFSGYTQFGPHKDDFEILFNNKKLKEVGSQGQQKLFLFCFKICEIKIFKLVTNDYPILLLDDLFSDLDIEKRNEIFKLINNEVQVFISSTDLTSINNEIIKSSKIFNIK